MQNNHSISAGRRLGIFITLFLLAASLHAAEIIVTATGVLLGGGNVGMFKAGSSIDKLPFKVVFRFDDSKGKPLLPAATCPNSGSGVIGLEGNAPGTAVLTINGVDYEFGKKKGLKAQAYRSIASACSEEGMSFVVDEGVGFYFHDVVNVTIAPTGKPYGLPVDWRTPFSTTDIKQWGASGFAITTLGMNKNSQSRFLVQSVKVERKEAANENR